MQVSAVSGMDRCVETRIDAQRVDAVHDVHVWTLTSEMESASAHLMTRDGTDSHSVLDQARHLLADTYEITHGTFQVEPDNHDGCHEVTW